MGVKVTSFKTKETQPDGTEIEIDMPGQANDCPPLPTLDKYKAKVDSESLEKKD
tara:strand:- start:1746 stop:1907 length:162 start_codon:yes stop_codon:yes gene_type:complete